MLTRPLPPSTRLTLIRGSVVLIFIILLGQLIRIQVIQGEGLRARADQNRFRLVEVRGQRGVMYDRNGQLLVRNRPSFNVVAIPADLPDDDDDAYEILKEVDRIISAYEGTSAFDAVARPAGDDVGTEEGSPVEFGSSGPPQFQGRPTVDEAMEDVLAGWQGGAYRPVIMADRVDRDIAFAVAEQGFRLPGVSLSIEPVREYLSSTLTSHILGYMGPIPQEYVEDYEAEGYRANDKVGLAGLEFTFEKALRGKDGRRNIEVDVNGREVRTVGESSPARPATIWC